MTEQSETSGAGPRPGPGLPQSPEKALPDIAERYRQLVELSPDAILIQCEGQIAFINRAGMRLLGAREPGEVVGRPVLEFVHPDHRAIVAARMAAVRTAGVNAPLLEEKYLRVDGGVVDVEVVAAPFRYEGRPAAQVVIRDITERKRAEQALRESEDRVRSLAEGLSGGMVYQILRRPDGTRRFTYLGDTVISLYGCTPQEAMADPEKIYGRVCPEDQERLFEEEESAHRTMSVFRAEARIRPPCGPIRWSSFVSNPRLLPDGSTLWSGIELDITAQKRAEEALRESEARFRSIVDASPMGMHLYELGDGGELIFSGANPAADRILGVNHSKFLGLRIEQAFPGLISTEVPARYREVAARGGQWRTDQIDYDRAGIRGAFEVVAFQTGPGRMVALFSDVTERKRSEKALRDSEARFRSIVETSQEWIWAVDAEGRHTYCNPAVEKILGFRPDEMVGRDAQPLLYEEDRGTAREALARSLAGRTGWSGLVLRWRHKDGSIRHLESTATPILNAAGDMAGLWGADRDITGQVRDQEQIQLLRNSIDAHRDGAYWMDSDNRIVYANDAAAKALGYRRDELQGMALSAINPLATPERMAKVWDRLRRNGFFLTESMHRRKDGSEFPVEVMSTYVRLAGKEYNCGFARDIAERKRTEKALRASEERYRALVEATDTGFVIIDFQGRVLDANREYVRLTGRGQLSEILGHSVVEWTAAHHGDKNAQAVELCSREGRVRQLEVDYVDGQGRFTPVEINATVVDTADGPRILTLVRDITNRRRTEQALQEAHAEKTRHLAFTEALLSAIPTPVFFKDAEGRYLGCNQAFAEQMGVTAEQIKGKTVEELWPGEHAAVYHAKDLELMRNPRRQIYEFKVRDRHGEDRNVIYAKDVFRDDAGRPAGIVGAYVDITDRRRAEEARAQNEARLRSVIESTADGLLVVDQDGRTIAANTRFAQLWRIPGDLLERGDDAALLAHVLDQLEDPQAFLAKVRRLYTTDAEDMDEIRFKDGRVFERYSRPLTMGGAVAGRVWSFRDITERRRAEEALRLSRQQLLTNLENTPHVAVQWYDEAGRVLYWNPASEKIYGFTSAEAVGKTLDQLILSPEEASFFLDTLRKISSTGQPCGPYEMQIRRRDGGSGWVLSTTFGMPMAEGRPGFVCMDVDITDRKRVEAERERLLVDLESRNAELERFTYTVSHDLRSPLITIRGFLAYLERDLAEGNAERLKSDVGRITSATYKMERLLQELLELSRVGRVVNPPEDAPFAAIVAEAAELVTGRLREHGVTLDVTPDLPAVRGDRRRLVEVLQNLLDNAAKFMGDQPTPRIQIGVRGEPAGGQAVFFVRDNGMGVDPQYCERVFGLFNKLDPKSEGTGVGLALVRRIVEVHGGRIWLESEGIGRGCTFCLQLPLAGANCDSQERGGDHEG
ncbi:MAG TPA: PAS domain S-box protein [Planctomycetota bacterium]|nr:PAS domain S-box protein [Planctomycetota bacterium]